MFICTDEEMQARGFYKERNYISWKNKYADMRLLLPYDEFLCANDDKKKEMMWDVIARAFDNIRKKKALADIDELEKDFKSVYWSV